MNKELKELIKTIREVFDGRSDAYLEGKVGNCRWRFFGPECDSPAAHELHLADAEKFDRWANSMSISISVTTILLEGGNLDQIVKRAVSIYE